MLYANRLMNALFFAPRILAGLLLFACYVWLLLTLAVVKWMKPENKGESFLYRQIIRCYTIGKKIHEKVMDRPLHWLPEVNLRVEPDDMNEE